MQSDNINFNIDLFVEMLPKNSFRLERERNLSLAALLFSDATENILDTSFAKWRCVPVILLKQAHSRRLGKSVYMW